MNSSDFHPFIEFLHADLGLSTEVVELAQKQQALLLNHLPIILWQYGLVTLTQLNTMFDWLENAPASDQISPLS
ncbi:DUF2949 domain-containing protein [Lyngbya confervoides]|uniref:DUF2949 domain-containing protein n=1 Tax=Lyngbya confervoides BDU141951 TaxID=1574623 RepID=A0ABD4T607_9CYAN|nr:DUF2949 domain-containing protein [Lyngbya confervoides]MCM1983910.1 DUF2949 domain-containing protein [Lyngbya confervoides BDU141951]